MAGGDLHVAGLDSWVQAGAVTLRRCGALFAEQARNTIGHDRHRAKEVPGSPIGLGALAGAHGGRRCLALALTAEAWYPPPARSYVADRRHEARAHERKCAVCDMNVSFVMAGDMRRPLSDHRESGTLGDLAVVAGHNPSRHRAHYPALRPRREHSAQLTSGMS